MRAPEFWYGRGAASRMTAALLSPVGWLYGGVTDWKRAHAVPYCARASVICVGNLTAGGTGKTPIVQEIARFLQARGLRTMILSRGYGGGIAGPVIVDPHVHCAADVGDEPLLLAQTTPVIVARNRAEGAVLADSDAAQVIVMDDGYQNFGLRKDISLVVVDAESGFGNGNILPAGPLRESVRHGLARADAVVLVGAGTPALPGYRGPVVRARLVPRDAQRFAGRRAIAFAGIGRPDKFFATLGGAGAEIVATFAFADHHRFGGRELARLRARAKNENAMLVTTEKDFVRLMPAERDGIETLPVGIAFDPDTFLPNLLEKIMLRHG